MTTKPGREPAQRDAPDVLLQLCALSADFESWWSDEETEEHLVDGVHSELTNHRLLMEFFDYFAKNHQALTEEQRRSLGAWVSEAVVLDDDLGEAVTVCFLRNCREAHLHRVLAPYLSSHATAKSHA